MGDLGEYGGIAVTLKQSEVKRVMHIKRNVDTKIVTILVGLVVLSGCILSNMGSNSNNEAHADTDHTATASVTVSSVCSMTANVTSPHTDTIEPGRYKGDGIGFTTITTFCNDNGGFAIYAIGFSGDKYGNTDMIGTGLDASYNIKTGTATSGSTSNWAMKITPVSGTYAPTVANGFGSFKAVPSEYAKIASFNGVTDAQSATGVGSSITTTYAAYISPAQVAGTYTGQVKYTMVHPSGAAAPEIPVFGGITTMQEMTPAICSTAAIGDSVVLKDNRDNTPYAISKLADGKCWMLDNLALDLTNDTVLNGLDTTNTNSDDPDALAALKGTSVRNPSTDSAGKYATAKVSNWTSSYSYSAPLVNMTDKTKVATDSLSSAENNQWKIGGYYNYCAASAGSYCYGNGTSAGTSSGNATSSICPKGWRLPTSNGGEYNALYTAYSSNYTNFRNAFHLPLSGYFRNGSADGQGSYGRFWSSTRRSNYFMYNLYADTSNIGPSDNYYRYYGYSVRCVAGS